MYICYTKHTNIMEALDLRSIVQQYISNADERLLHMMKAVAESYRDTSERTDWFDEMNAQEKQEIELGLLQSKRGELISNQEVKQVFSKWH